MTSLERELEEAYRQLRKSTGCDWRNTIKDYVALIEAGWSLDPCPRCGGSGDEKLDAWSRAEGLTPDECQQCRGKKEIWTRA